MWKVRTSFQIISSRNYSSSRILKVALSKHILEPEIGEPKREALILHGLFGNSSNWRTVARKLVDQAKVRCHLLDVRNHGSSPHTEEMSYQAMSNDLVEYIEKENLKEKKITIIGHSLGGKIGMKFSLDHPTLLSELVVVDIAPVNYHQSFVTSYDKYIDAMLKIDLTTLESRSKAESLLEDVVKDKFVRQFLVSNLVWKGRESSGSGPHYYWRFNLPVLKQYLAMFGQYSFDHEKQLQQVCTRPTLFLYGSNSTYVKLPEYEAQIKTLFPNSEFCKVEGAGHWVHSEKPDQVVQAIHNFLLKNY